MYGEELPRYSAAPAGRRDDLEHELTRESAGFREHEAREALTPDQLRKLLPAGTALIDYFVYRHYAPAPTRRAGAPGRSGWSRSRSARTGD